jgi:hypothetical protein
MEPTPPLLPNSILIDDKTSPWYPQTIVRHAQAEIPDHFKALPDLWTLQFKHYVINNENYRGKGSWPKDALTMMIAVGVYDSPAKNTLPPVYAFVYGEKRNRVGYFYTLDESTFVSIQPGNFSHIDLEEPFSDVDSFAHVRAMVLYYSLAAGYIEVMGDYSAFWGDFKRACGWVANKGNRPKPHPKREASGSGDEFATDEKFQPTIGKQRNSSP